MCLATFPILLGLSILHKFRIIMWVAPIALINDSWHILTFDYSGESTLQCFPLMTYMALIRCNTIVLCDRMIIITIQLIGAGA